jgi:hypothetical protein
MTPEEATQAYINRITRNQKRWVIVEVLLIVVSILTIYNIIL